MEANYSLTPLNNVVRVTQDGYVSMATFSMTLTVNFTITVTPTDS